MVQDHYHSLSGALLVKHLEPGRENIEPVPDGALINGKALCHVASTTCDDVAVEVFNLQSGKNHRLRFINVGAFAEFQIQIDEHDFAVIEIDGTDVYALNSVRFHRLHILPAQRCSVVLSTNVSSQDSYWMRARMVTHCFGEDNPRMQEEVRAIVQFTSAREVTNLIEPPAGRDWPDVIETECRDLNLSLLYHTILDSPPESADATVFLRANFEIGAWRLSRGFFNHTSWQPNIRSPLLQRILEGLAVRNSSFAISEPAGVNDKAFDVNRDLVYQTPRIKVLDIIISNFDDGAYPFHLHGSKFWVLASGLGYPPISWSYGVPTDAVDTNAAVKRDAATVEAFGWTLLRVVADNPGVWAFHCHVSWHMEAGLVMAFWMRNNEMSVWNIPKEILDLCETEGIEKGSAPKDEMWYGNVGSE